MIRLKGIGVSPGVAIGRAVLLRQRPLALRFSVPKARVSDEVARLEEAREASRRQLLDIKARVASGPGSELAYLFDAQLMMLDDPALVPRAAAIATSNAVNAEWALERAYDEVAGVFNQVEDAYLRERKGDVADVVGRLRMNLGRDRETPTGLFRDVRGPSVLVADELTPSMAAQVDWRKMLGFVSDTGSRTYHTAILARSLDVPAVVALGEASRSVGPGSLVIIDGTAGELIVDPTDQVVEEYRARAARVGTRPLASADAAGSPLTTADGIEIRLLANVELPEDLDLARRYGAHGIGLYRSEFLLATGLSDSADEDAQYAAYRSMVEAMAPHPVTIRTFDVDEAEMAEWPAGGSGWRGRHAAGRSHGPLGLRAIRLSLAERGTFRRQLRAMLRAARHGQVRIIFPFISGVEEARAAREVVREVHAELAASGDTPPHVPTGVMIEVPSAALTADVLAAEVDFFSIGTNDLIQYLLAVDRTDARVSRLYEPLHPAVLRTVRSVITAATKANLPVSLCGEMASDPVLIPLLIGLGLTEFSMTPAAMPVARQVIRRVHGSRARRAAARVLRLGTADEIERALAGVLGEMRRAPASRGRSR